MPDERDPRYVIADWLREEIGNGTYPPGAAVPSENELVTRWGVAKATAQAALSVLKAEGLLESRQGAATRVRTYRPILRQAGRRLSADTWGSGQSIWSVDQDGRQLVVDQVSVAEEPAHERIALGLDVPPGTPVCTRRRRYVLDGRAVMLSTSYLPAALVTGTAVTQADSGPGGTYARLAEIGHAPVHFVELVRARTPLQEERKGLDLPQGSPVIEITRTALTSQQRPIEVNVMVCDANAYVLRYDVDA